MSDDALVFDASAPVKRDYAALDAMIARIDVRLRQEREGMDRLLVDLHRGLPS